MEPQSCLRPCSLLPQFLCGQLTACALSRGQMVQTRLGPLPAPTQTTLHARHCRLPPRDQLRYIGKLTCRRNGRSRIIAIRQALGGAYEIVVCHAEAFS